MGLKSDTMVNSGILSPYHVGFSLRIALHVNIYLSLVIHIISVLSGSNGVYSKDPYNDAILKPQAISRC